MNLKNFFSELKRRNVYKVAVAYAVVGWLLVQVATQVFPFLEIPNWVVRLVVLLLILGFPWRCAMNLRNFFAELKRPNVYQLAVAILRSACPVRT